MACSGHHTPSEQEVHNLNEVKVSRCSSCVAVGAFSVARRIHGRCVQGEKASGNKRCFFRVANRFTDKRGRRRTSAASHRLLKSFHCGSPFFGSFNCAQFAIRPWDEEVCQLVSSSPADISLFPSVRAFNRTRCMIQ
ncbi:hypothetical protein BaRGS_00015865 [Batillaria attramentaria]|uniref:Uncharacterized protein n=1 Tax=Batillaria attramentaria TaxID=370345 RepID=A0ABD0L123_9CAEN